MAHTACCVRQKSYLSVVHVKYLWISSLNFPLPSPSLPSSLSPLHSSLLPTSSLPFPSCPLPSFSCYDHHCLCNYVHTCIPYQTPHVRMYVYTYICTYSTTRLLLPFSAPMLCPLPALRFEDALADFSETLRLVPSMACAHINIGLVHLKRFRNPER